MGVRAQAPELVVVVVVVEPQQLGRQLPQAQVEPVGMGVLHPSQVHQSLVQVVGEAVETLVALGALVAVALAPQEQRRQAERRTPAVVVAGLSRVRLALVAQVS